MHADERNREASDRLGRNVFHYHLHVVYLPVVEKQIRWSKRCKDPALRGTVCPIGWLWAGGIRFLGRLLVMAQVLPPCAWRQRWLSRQ